MPAPSNDFGSPEYTGFSAAYTTQFAEEPVIFAHNMYDAAALLVLAIVDAESTTGANVRESLFSVSVNDGGDTAVLPGALVNGIGLLEGGTGIDYNGAGGNVDFLDNGDVISSYEIWAWDGTAEAFETVGSVDGDDIEVD